MISEKSPVTVTSDSPRQNLAKSKEKKKKKSSNGRGLAMTSVLRASGNWARAMPIDEFLFLRLIEEPPTLRAKDGV